mgnify:CR=1 FL=1
MQGTKLSAYLLIATGVLHNAIGFIISAPVLGDIASEGFFNTVVMQHDRNAAFWFLFSGFALILMGLLLLELRRIPRTFAWALLTLNIIGVVIMPVSGLWLVLPQAVYMLRQNVGKRLVSI